MTRSRVSFLFPYRLILLGGADGVHHLVHIALHLGALRLVGGRLHDDIGHDKGHAVVAEAAAIALGVPVGGGDDVVRVGGRDLEGAGQAGGHNGIAAVSGVAGLTRVRGGSVSLRDLLLTGQEKTE